MALANADGTFASAKLTLSNFSPAQGWSSNDSFPRFATDVNHDNLADIVGFGVAGTYIAYGKGDGTFADPVLDLADFGINQGWSSENAFPREVADMNHDGLADLVGFGQAGVLIAQHGLII